MLRGIRNRVVYSIIIGVRCDAMKLHCYSDPTRSYSGKSLPKKSLRCLVTTLMIRAWVISSTAPIKYVAVQSCGRDILKGMESGLHQPDSPVKFELLQVL